MPLSDLIDVSVVGSLRGFEMNRIPGLTNLKCPKCGGNIMWDYDISLGQEVNCRERKCLQCGRPYGEQEPTLPLTHQVGHKEVNDGS